MSRRSTRSRVVATPSTGRKRPAEKDTVAARPNKSQRLSAVSHRATAQTRSPHFSSPRVYADNTGLTSTEDESDEDDDYDSEASEFGMHPKDPTVGVSEPEDYDDESSDDDEDEDSSSSTDSETRRRRRRQQQQQQAQRRKVSGHATSPTDIPKSRTTNGHDLLREGAVLATEPGVEVVIKRPKARGPGKTPYADHTIHPNTMLFLRELRENNERSWLKVHDPDFRAAENDFKAFIERLTEKLCEVDETLPELPVKDIIFRIYRDVRFSKDPTPYKPFFSAAWSRTGRKGPYAAYYLQLQPGKTFLGGGAYGPDAQALARMRADIDRRPHRIRAVLSEAGLRQEFLDRVSKQDKKVIKAFVDKDINKNSALKTCPKGFDKDHKDIALLRLKNYVVGHTFDDAEVVKPDFLDRVVQLFEIMLPFITYLNNVIMPDPTARQMAADGDGEDDGDGENGEDGENSDEDEEADDT